VRTKWYAIYSPFVTNLYIATDPIPDYLSTPQSRPQGPCQCSERVSCIVNFSFSLLIMNRMLYEFHRQQNAKKPGTVHATYLISGTKQVEDAEAMNGTKKDGEDEYMQSSPFMSSSMPQPDQGTGESSTLTISLTREEDLDSIASLCSRGGRMLIHAQIYGHNMRK
jgi:hypothetical protein